MHQQPQRRTQSSWPGMCDQTGADARTLRRPALGLEIQGCCMKTMVIDMLLSKWPSESELAGRESQCRRAMDPTCLVGGGGRGGSDPPG